MVTHLEKLFPGLQGTAYRISSPRDDHYNCIAWAAGDTSNWWWPGDPVDSIWPPSVPHEVTMAAFRHLFSLLGYVECTGEELEVDVDKIALFADATGTPTHAARQLPNGLWTSKLGYLEDIEHALHNVAGDNYGSVAVLMKRPLRAIPSPLPPSTAAD